MVAWNSKAPKGERESADKELNKIFEDAPRFATYGEVEMALAQDRVSFHSPVWYWISKDFGGLEEKEGRWERTTAGRVLFNSIIPDELGFINHVVPADQVMAKAMEIAATIAANGPLAVRAIKSAARALLGVPEEEAMRMESRLAAPVFASKDAVEGPKAFLEKRAPSYEGH